MTRKIRLHHLFAMVVFALLLVPGLSLAEEPSALNGIQVESAVPAPGAPLDMILNSQPDQGTNASSNQEEITLETLKQTFGARNVCALSCVSNAHCRDICNDLAVICYQKRCIYT